MHFVREKVGIIGIIFFLTTNVKKVDQKERGENMNLFREHSTEEIMEMIEENEKRKNATTTQK